MKIKPVQRKIALISDDPERIEKYSRILTDPTNKIISCTFDTAINKVLIEEPLDLAIIDAVSIDDLDYRIIEPLRSHTKFAAITLIFILNTNQQALKRQIYKNPHNKIILEPVDKYAFLSLINTSLHMGQLEKRVSDHDEVLIELVREIRKLIDTPKPKRKPRSIGFIVSDETER